MAEDSQSTQNQNKEKSAQDEYLRIVKPVRTYERDLAELVRKKKASQASVRIEEQKKEEGAGTIKRPKQFEIKRPSSLPKIFLGTLVVLILVTASFSLFRFLSNPKIAKEIKVSVPVTENLLSVDSTESINLTGISPEEYSQIFENELNKLPKERGKIVAFHLSEGNNQGQNRTISSKEFLNRIAPNAPSFLIRALGEKMTFGFLIDEINSPFMILEVDSFENAFAGMLEWEKVMAKDLNPIISKTRTDRKFEDLTLKNKDARILTENGSAVILYSFLNQNLLLITNSEETFKVLVDRQ